MKKKDKTPVQRLTPSELLMMMRFVQTPDKDPVTGLFEKGLIEPSGNGMFQVSQKGRDHLQKVLFIPIESKK